MKMRMTCASMMLFFLAAGCMMELPQDAEVTVQVSVDIRDGGRADRILVAPGELFFHIEGTPRAAAWRGEPLSPGAWVSVATHDAGLDLASFQTREAALLAQGTLPAFTYDHVFVKFGSIRALDKHGKEIPIEDIVEPIAIKIAPGALRDVRVHVELIVLNDWPVEGSLAVFVKHAELVED